MAEDDRLLRGLLFDDARTTFGLPLRASLREEVTEARRFVRRKLVVGRDDEEAADGVVGLVFAAERDVVEGEEAIDLDLLLLRVVWLEQRGRERLDRLFVLLVFEELLALRDQVGGLAGGRGGRLRGPGGLRRGLRERDAHRHQELDAEDDRHEERERFEERKPLDRDHRGARDISAAFGLPGDLFRRPFCGLGRTTHAAQAARKEGRAARSPCGVLFGPPRAPSR